jgi:hypothetical protein
LQGPAGDPAAIALLERMAADNPVEFRPLLQRYQEGRDPTGVASTLNPLPGCALLDRGGETMADGPVENALEHIADGAALLAAASCTEGERRFAEEHAAACLPCREALDEAVRLTELLKRALRASGGDL